MSGPEELKAVLARMAERLPIELKEAFWQEGGIIVARAQEIIPKDTGYAASTGYVNDPTIDSKGVEMELGFWANYALPLHDIPPPPAKSEGGRSAYHAFGSYKFLEIPLEQRAPYIRENIIARVIAAARGA